MKTVSKWALPLAAVLLLLSACQTYTPRQQSAPTHDPLLHQQTADDRLKAKSLYPPHHAGNGDPRAIPSVDRMKTRTTNEFGGTSYGLGSSVYSVIGSSGLHGRGLSSHLESRLRAAGVQDIRVFTLDDTVILAADNNRMQARQYDPLQQKLLSGTSGLSGHGVETAPPGQLKAKSSASNDPLTQAERWIKDNMGGVTVYKLTGEEAVNTIDRIRSHSGSSRTSPRQMAADVQRLLQLAERSRK